MKKCKCDLGARLLLGLIFLIFGSNGLMMILTGSGFIPMPEPKPEMAAIMGGLFGMKYLMPLVKLLQVVSAILLLTGNYVNLALTLLAPIVINILGVHLFVDLSGAPVAIVVTLLWGYLLHKRWSDFRVLLKK